MNEQIKQTFGIDLTPYVPKYYGNNTSLSTFTAPYNSQISKYSATNAMIANINSSHGGGANVAFCDGHVAFARDDIGTTLATNSASFTTYSTGLTSIPVYQIMVTPDGSKKHVLEPAC